MNARFPPRPSVQDLRACFFSRTTTMAKRKHCHRHWSEVPHLIASQIQTLRLGTGQTAIRKSNLPGGASLQLDGYDRLLGRSDRDPFFSQAIFGRDHEVNAVCIRSAHRSEYGPARSQALFRICDAQPPCNVNSPICWNSADDACSNPGRGQRIVQSGLRCLKGPECSSPALGARHFWRRYALHCCWRWRPLSATLCVVVIVAYVLGTLKVRDCRLVIEARTARAQAAARAAGRSHGAGKSRWGAVERVFRLIAPLRMENLTAYPRLICVQSPTVFRRSSLSRRAYQYRCADLYLSNAGHSSAFHCSPWGWSPKLSLDMVV